MERELKIRLIDKNHNEEIFSNLSEKHQEIIENHNFFNKSQNIRLRHETVRIGSYENDFLRAELLSSEKDFVKSSKKFRSYAEVYLHQARSITGVYNQARKKSERHSTNLLHNISSLNAMCIQEIYSLVSQNKLRSEPKKNAAYIISELRDNPADFARAFVSIVKLNTAIKNEISVYSRLFGISGNLDFQQHRLHKVLMNVAYLFFPDFNDRRINVDVEPSIVDGFFDYETMHVAFFHLFDNAQKYMMEDENLTISTERKKGYIYVSFSMKSLKLYDAELLKISTDGFSGREPEKMSRSGHGLGMARVKQLTELNNGGLEFERIGDDIIGNENERYQENVFRISLRAK